MFNEDNFGIDENYSIIYQQLGGELPHHLVNEVIQQSYSYLDERYPDPKYHDNFPKLIDVINKVSNYSLSAEEVTLLINTFATHECGVIPEKYITALRQLKQHYSLALVIDIWSPKTVWLNYFREIKILNWFQAISFSSDHGHVKPSPFGFLQVLNQLKQPPDKALFIGDSIRRDIGGANATGLDCILVGSKSELAIDSYPDLLTLCSDWGIH